MIGLAFLACVSGDPTPATDDGSPTPTPTPSAPTLDATATATARPTVVDITFDVPGTGVGWVLYGEGNWDQRVDTVRDGTGHRARLVALPSGGSIHWQAFADVNGVVSQSEQALWEVAPVEAATPSVVAQVVDPMRSEVVSGQVAIAWFGPSTGTSVVDGAGRTTWWMPADPGRVIANVQPARDGRGWLIQDADLGFQELGSVIRRVDWDGTVLSETALPTGHHQFTQEADGRFGWLGLQFGEVDGVSVLTDTVGLVAEGGAERTKVFRFLDDWVPYYVPCIHAEIPQDIWGEVGLQEWTHVNSLVSNASGDGWWVGVRLPDAILSLSTTGALEWQAGGPAPTLANLTPEFGWSHVHFSQAWDDHLLVFDNGTHRDPPASRVIEVVVDPAAGTVRTLWSVDEPQGGYSFFLGDARRLPGGNTLIAWTGQGRLDEVTPDGDVVWTATVTTPNVWPGRIWFLPTPTDLAGAFGG